MGKFFITRPIFAIALAIAIVIIGSVSMLTLSVEQYPDITPPMVQVTATYEGADAQTVNDAVATPIGESIMGVENMLYMQTTSANDGSMTLQAIFDIGTDPDINAILTQNKVSTASSLLPESVTKEGVVTMKLMSSMMMVYALTSDGRYDDSFLTNYADINITDELLKISGVEMVMVMGAGDYAMRIWLDPERLAYYGITVDEVTEAIDTQGGIYPAGKFGAQPTGANTTYTYTVILPPQISTAEEFGEIILRSSSDSGTIRLSDVARINLGQETYEVTSRYNTSPAAMLVIYQSPGSNAVEVGNKVRALISKLSKRLPDTINCELVVDSTKSIKAGISDIFRTLLIALVLVIIIIYLFLQDWRATLIPLIAIPVSLLGAFIIFPMLGFSINIISLLGLVLAIGLVVDDAIVVVEAAQLNISNGMSPVDASHAAMQSVTSPIIATTVVLLAVFIPVSFQDSLTGLLFQQFAVVLSVSVVISAINALTLSPALCSLLLRKKEPATKGFFAAFNRGFSRTMERYTSTVGTFVKHVGRTAILVAILLIAIVAGWRLIPQGFLPEEDQGYVMVMVETPTNSVLSTTLLAMEHVGEVIMTDKDVESISFAAGYNMLAGIASTNCGVIFVELVDYADRTATAAEIATRFNEELYIATPESMSYAFIPPSIPGLGLDSGVTFEVQDLEGRGGDYLYEQTKILMDSLQHNPMVASVTTQYESGISQRKLNVDVEHAISLGIEPSELYSLIGTMLGGTYLNNFNRFGRLYETYIEAAPEFRESPDALQNIYISNSSGEQIPLSSVVSVTETTGVEFVSQFNLYRSIGITLTPSSKVSSSQAMDLIDKTVSAIMPPDIGVAWSGVSYVQAGASKDGGVVYLLAIVFVFLSLAALYNSWSMPLAILLGVPIAVVGALCFSGIAHLSNALYVNDVYMQISLVMLIGLAAKNSILVVEYAERISQEDGKSLLDAAIEAARLRVRPIVMTAFAFILGVFPLVFASGVYSTARNIMGVALVGGMLFATIFGVYLYPALYYLISRIGVKKATVILLAVSSMSCAPQLPKAVVVTPEEWLYGDTIDPDSTKRNNWWESFGDPTLDSLIEHALLYNRDLLAATTRIESARANLRVVRAEYLPKLYMDVEAKGDYASSTWTQEYYAMPTISWELSLFGAMREAKKRAKAEILESQWALQGVRLSVAGEVAKSYFTLREARENLRIAEQSYSLRLAEAQLLDSMVYYGMADAVAQQQARSLLYTAAADISTYRRAEAQTRLSLGVLLGETPTSEEIPMGEIALPPSVAMGVPSELVERRPDVMESYYEMSASAASVGIARAERYPSITLTGGGGVLSTTIKGLTEGKPWAWSLVGELTAPIFSWGELKSSERMARSAYMASVYDYEESCLNAFAEVEEALVAVESYGTQRGSLVSLVIANSTIARSVNALYKSGMESYLNVIDAERDLYESQMELSNVIAEHYISYVSLYLALGGY